ncbi:alpha/beta hydrolase [Streptomonospora nanhaiensis]|uniref:DUF1023 domain-containing protein n=1 Tax=Streptomonospora nanhaiensis TaxID=1323731 RepID=A0A853BL75_9ACTN|nr:alpha/beta hydrolase [Streptomonospora nanhaiensis]MBV2361941.1 alpha/beta hydrolase family protein [Streptomonospora nanhaiensis]MBX9390916.1 alpha/beta hydrolase family protein [Streptomonospora nanhaiensis]NYI96238.1 hypothetical protein [Streptomonospora nanhaiensis]
MADRSGGPRRRGVLGRLLGRTRTAPTPAESARPDPRIPQTTPAGYARWWRGLDPAERDRLVREDPAALGALDGLPAEVRDAANRRVLREYLEANTDKDVAILSRVLAVHDREPTRMYLMQFTPPSRPGAGDGLAAVSAGNPDTAKRRLVIVPGAGTDLHNIGRNIRRITRIKDEADAKAGTVGASDHAVLVWQGARAPKFGPEAARLDLALAAREPLRNFLAGLEARDPLATSTTTVYGLSYGSLVVAQAAAGTADSAAPGSAESPGFAADNVILGASPGMGEGVSGVADLRVAPGRAYALASDADSITYLPPSLHGVNPAAADSGLIRLATDPHGHHDYVEPGVGLDNVVAVFTGATDDLVPAAPRPPGGSPWKVLRHARGVVRRQESASGRRPRAAATRTRPGHRPWPRRGGRRGP